MIGSTSSYILWCIALVTGIPLLVIFLNECIDRSRRQKLGYTKALSVVRDIILPLFVALIVLRYIFVVSDANIPVKLLSTAFWLVLMVSIFRLTRTIIDKGEYPADDWRSLVPQMFLRLPPYAIMGFIVYHVIQNLWAFPVREMAATLGIGSIVIAFALQDTLSNLVSGLLLVANSPFKPGDWVNVSDVEGQITVVNWRYTHIQTESGDLVVIPNGSIAGESITNFSRPDKITSVIQKFSISFEHSPNEVSRFFHETLDRVDGILKDPQPAVDVINIDDPAMEYQIEYWVEDFGKKAEIHAKFMSNVWYALHRHNISLPTTQYDVHNYNGSIYNAAVEKQEQALKSCLDWLPHFSKLPSAIRSDLAAKSAYQRYSEQETILKKYDNEPGLCVIVNGSVSYRVNEQTGKEQPSRILKSGGFFGEAGLFGRADSPATVIANEDTEILCLPHNLVNEVINQNPLFATSIDSVIDERKSYLQATSEPVKSISDVLRPLANAIED